MQQYIFRGLTEDNNWVYGSLIQRTDGIGKLSLIEVQDKDGEITVWQVKDDSVGQFVRTSELGENIFLGDILEEDPGCKSRFEVVWDRQYSKFKLDCTRVCDHIQYPEWNRGVKMKIIGNVHSNPELLPPPTT
jgi:hypothetical protein